MVYVLVLVLLQLLCIYDAYNSSRCCHFVGDAGRITGCLTDESPEDIAAHAFATVISPQIYSYAANAALHNQVMLRHGGHICRILSHMSNDDYYPSDRRWNKVLAAERALRTWAVKSSYLVLFDADLFILNPQFSIASTVASYPDAMLIFGLDEIDIANTGMMIIRNDPWSSAFLQRWWDNHNSDGAECDQHVLNKLIEGLSDEDAGKVAIVPAKLVNSVWPAIRNFEESDPILHLMGETNAVRERIARHIVEDTCQQLMVSSVTVDASQFATVPLPLRRANVTKSILQDLRKDVIMSKLTEAMSRSVAYADDFTAWADVREHLGQLCAEDKRESDMASVRMCLDLTDSVIQLHQRVLKKNNAPALVLIHRQELSLLLVGRTSLCAAKRSRKSTAGNAGQDQDQQLAECAQAALDSLDLLSSLLLPDDAQNVAFLHHQRGRVFATLAQYYNRRRQWNQAIEFDMICITEIGSLLQNIVAQPSNEQTSGPFAGYVTLYVQSAMRLVDSYLQVDQLNEALEWAEIAINNAKMLFESSSNELRARGNLLHSAYLLGARVALAVGDDDRQQDYRLAAHTLQTKLR